MVGSNTVSPRLCEGVPEAFLRHSGGVPEAFRRRSGRKITPALDDARQHRGSDPEIRAAEFSSSKWNGSPTTEARGEASWRGAHDGPTKRVTRGASTPASKLRSGGKPRSPRQNPRRGESHQKADEATRALLASTLGEQLIGRVPASTQHKGWSCNTQETMWCLLSG